VKKDMGTEYTRIAIIDKDKCQPKNCNYLCYRSCPPVRMGQEAIVIDEKTYNTPIINENLCTGCGICPHKCPTKAIKIINIGVKMSEPLHQFGKNSFRLYSLPFPEKGHITGIIGRNGAGKSTSINILSGSLVPNLGDYKEKGDINKVIEYFRGKSIQNHFIDLKNKKVNIAYKIQKVEEIPKYFDKPIIELLTSVNNNTDQLNEIVNELDLASLLNKKPQEISGGELQKVSIAATLLKNASIYFLDEYTTFLDIKQRFKIAKLLHKKVNPENSIMLIEHDLAILDYASDFIQIMFGTKAAYGVSSNKKTTKKGINEFLEGFLKEENIRIREHQIEFKSLKDSTTIKRETLYSYPDLRKKLGEFKLEIKEGELKTSEVIGILGPNAIGKTTFIKILAGEIEPDNLELKNKLKISYKPQYINLDNNQLVFELFINKETDNDLFNAEIKNQFEIEPLMELKIGDLSGGELQKVAIAYSLSRYCDIYLIDEPSAFLDIEQRLIIANVIKSVINKSGRSALVVDHDLLFIDYISDRILLFEGIPGKEGIANKIDTIENSFNKFLKTQDITFRKDPDTKRPRANKPESQKDQEQKKDNKYYYTL